MEENREGWKKLKVSPHKMGNATHDPAKTQGNITPDAGHTSQGHGPHSGGAVHAGEPTLRGTTTDSSRIAKSANDDLPTGGNIR